MKLIWKRFLGMVLFALTAAAMAEPAELRQISLEEAVSLSIRQGYQMGIAREQLAAAQGENLAAWQGLLPRVTLSSGYVRSDDPVTVFGLKLKQGVFSQSDFALRTLNRPENFEDYGSEIRVELPVLNLDAIFGKSAAAMLVNARKQSVKRTEEAAVFQTKTAYYGLVLSYESLRAIELAIQSAEAHRNDARSAFEQELINEAEYLAAEVRLAELQEQKIVAENQIRGVSDQLKLMLGLAEESRLLSPGDSLPLPGNLSAGGDAFPSAARRADLQALHFQRQAAQRNLQAVRSGWLPRLNAFATKEWHGSAPFGNDSNNLTIGLRLSWDIFDGLGRAGGIRQAAAQYHQREIGYRQALHRAGNEISAARRDLVAAQKRVEVANTAVRQAQKSLRIVAQRHREGLEKTSHLLDREVMLTNARLRLLQAKYDYYVAVTALDYARGR